MTKVEERIQEKKDEEFEAEAVSLPVARKEYVVCADTLGSDKEIT